MSPSEEKVGPKRAPLSVDQFSSKVKLDPEPGPFPELPQNLYANEIHGCEVIDLEGKLLYDRQEEMEQSLYISRDYGPSLNLRVKRSGKADHQRPYLIFTRKEFAMDFELETVGETASFIAHLKKNCNVLSDKDTKNRFALIQVTRRGAQSRAIQGGQWQELTKEEHVLYNEYGPKLDGGFALLIRCSNKHYRTLKAMFKWMLADQLRRQNLCPHSIDLKESDMMPRTSYAIGPRELLLPAPDPPAYPPLPCSTPPEENHGFLPLLDSTRVQPRRDPLPQEPTCGTPLDNDETVVGSPDSDGESSAASKSHKKRTGDWRCGFQAGAAYGMKRHDAFMEEEVNIKVTRDLTLLPLSKHCESLKAQLHKSTKEIVDINNEYYKLMDDLLKRKKEAFDNSVKGPGE